ncbi:MAG: glutamate formimidoyltransferase [Bacteroidia bacterium]|nr:glutamate formimidoyltransferase [Bacteroidia bacterium]MCX7652279.1 glutamate formimidoyltransferase [Bacteroidia bacterium]MDW8416541.1 glutamate formimidoyltransferase [Bacteroidia bacterium]
MEPVLLCTPNFSEGLREEVIQAILQPIKATPGVKLMVVDKGSTVNRTVIAFGGEPEAVFNAARSAYEVALKHIDMRHHRGVHPRIGAVDVCPFTPYRGVEKAWLLRRVESFAQEIGDTFRLPVYLYAESARSPERRSLPNIRKGGYEKLPEKLRDPFWSPDFGPIAVNARSGATAIGVRDFIAAFNLTLNTRSETIGKRIAESVRESSGGLPNVQAISWFLPEVGFVQVSLNITDLRATPLHKAFEAVEEAARQLGARVSETEIVGILPEWALIDAGRYFAQKAGESVEKFSRDELILTAIRSLMLKDFDPESRCPERVFGEAVGGQDLGELSLRELLWRMADKQQPIAHEVAVVLQVATALGFAARAVAGLPARHAFAHAEFVQLLQDTLLFLQDSKMNIEALRTLGKKALRGFALLRQISETLSADQKEQLVLLGQLFSCAVDSLAAALISHQSNNPEIAQERHDIELQGRFFREEIFKRVRI